MRVKTIARAIAFALVVAGTSILAAPGQTLQPGQMTQGRVWIENRGRQEAVPIDVEGVHLDAPIKVQVINADATNTNPVQVHHVRVLWDYETITVKANEDVTARVNAQGALGWETTGIWAVDGAGVTKLLLKRPR
jgi:hypothetical protein